MVNTKAPPRKLSTRDVAVHNTTIEQAAKSVEDSPYKDPMISGIISGLAAIIRRLKQSDTTVQ